MANEARPRPCDIGDGLDCGGLGPEVEVEHTKAYVVKPTCASDKALIVIQDIHGWQLPSTRYMADIHVSERSTDSLFVWPIGPLIVCLCCHDQGCLS